MGEYLQTKEKYHKEGSLSVGYKFNLFYTRKCLLFLVIILLQPLMPIIAAIKQSFNSITFHLFTRSAKILADFLLYPQYSKLLKS